MGGEVLTIRQVAKQTGVSSKTLRYWESAGLLPPAQQNYNNYRLYGPAVSQRVTFIRKAKSVGFTLAEIRARRTGSGLDFVIWQWSPIRPSTLTHRRHHFHRRTRHLGAA